MKDFFSGEHTLSNNTCTPSNCSDGDEGLFCRDFSHLPTVYFACSCLSALCCFIVFLTFYMFPRLSGYSSNVFLFR